MFKLSISMEQHIGISTVDQKDSNKDIYNSFLKQEQNILLLFCQKLVNIVLTTVSVIISHSQD